MISLLRRIKLRRPQLQDVKVTIYSRAECCCCHTAIDLIEGYRKRHGFEVETVDIDNDPELVEAYNLSVPVVAVNGKVRFRGVVNPVLLDRLLSAEIKAREV